MRISHEAIYQALHVQSRGALRRDLTVCLRTGRALRVPRSRAHGRAKSFISDEVMICERPGEAADRTVPSPGTVRFALAYAGDMFSNTTVRASSPGTPQTRASP